jgi:acetyl-CoA C-acetyltransferase
MSEAFVVSACRTAVGGFGGALQDVPAPTLGAAALREALRRAGADAAEVDEVILGHVLQAGHEICPARVAALEAGIPEPVPAFAINKACGSGLKAVALGAQAIRAGDAEVVLAGGMENMNRVPYALDRARTGYRMGNAPVVDLLVHGLTCPVTKVHMGVTAENVAKRHGISREEQDAFAAASYEKALKAQAAGKFRDEIFALEVPQKKGEPLRFEQDEDVRPTPLEALAKLRPAFLKDGTVTAGNASNIDDGASALLLASERALRAKGWAPIARVLGAASAGVDPGVMGLGPARAVPRLLAKLGWKADDVDLFELNEAFAAQALGVLRELPEIDRERVNVNGGAIALGHPVGASGARILTTLLHALRDRGGRRGVASLCIGSGMGIALGVELV